MTTGSSIKYYQLKRQKCKTVKTQYRVSKATNRTVKDRQGLGCDPKKLNLEIVTLKK